MKRKAYRCKSDTFRFDRDEIMQNVRHHRPAERDLILKRLAERWTFERIGRALEVSEMTAKRRFREAVKELQKRIVWDKSVKGDLPKNRGKKPVLVLKP